MSDREELIRRYSSQAIDVNKYSYVVPIRDVKILIDKLLAESETKLLQAEARIKGLENALDEMIETYQYEASMDNPVLLEAKRILANAIQLSTKTLDTYVEAEVKRRLGEPVAWQGLGILSFEKPQSFTEMFSPLYAIKPKNES